MTSGPTPHTTPLRCVVAGAGVVGVTTAWRLAQAGVEVTLVDGGDRVGLGASWATFAHVNASYAGYWDYVELRRAGVDGYAGLRRELDGAPWWHDTGFLVVYGAHADVAAHDRHLDRLRATGYPAECVEARPSLFEPALGDVEAVRTHHFPTEGWVDVPRMLADLQDRAGRLGVGMRADDPVIGVEPLGDGIAVRLRSGETLRCDRLVVACGRWTDEVLATAGITSAFVAHDTALGTPVPGLLVATGPVQGSVGRVVAVDDVNLRPRGDGGTLLWSGKVDQQLQERGGEHAAPSVVDRLAAELLRAATEHVPALSGTDVADATVTQRALPVDGLPVVGPLAAAAGIHVALAHAAVTLAPALADIVVDEVVHARPDPRVDRFRPGRLTPVRTHHDQESSR